MRQKGLNMNKLFKFMWLCAIPLTVVGCDSVGSKKEVIIFAAASMTESLNAVKKTFESLNPSTELLINYGSSGTLKDQILEGAKCDIFVSAGKKQMDAVAAEIIAESRKDVLENQVALVTSRTTTYSINSFTDLQNTLQGILDTTSYTGNFKIGLGGSSVPVGQYSTQILNTLLGDNAVDRLKAKGVVSEGANVKEVTTQVDQGLVDVALIYKTDANSANLVIKDLATEELCSRSIYPFAMLTRRSNANLTDLVYTYICNSDRAKTAYQAVGFTVL